MLTHVTRDELHTIIRLAERAKDAGDRLVNRANKVELSANAEQSFRTAEEERQNWAQTADALRETGLTGPVQSLDDALGRLSPEALREVHAIALIGRGDYAARQWEEAVGAAEALSDASEPRMLADMDALPAYLSKGLYQLRLS